MLNGFRNVVLGTGHHVFGQALIHVLFELSGEYTEACSGPDI
jgi:hypothetical protein